ncbi:hypothetical protein [Tuwongella immobilis]|uniref:Uncharacterized protein n=1 Tax=Tuwongella immobilis TaxID=692036 RepID=A0A6C2YJP0_9BACT|nr:hypothetical protein [Tuwongella immobilis]VIP01790.1 unnamed protein product [Tuwongella immobilis]VTR99457.1 unnamed protein product [Tuwongella immobilis]
MIDLIVNGWKLLQFLVTHRVGNRILFFVGVLGFLMTGIVLIDSFSKPEPVAPLPKTALELEQSAVDPSREEWVHLQDGVLGWSEALTHIMTRTDRKTNETTKTVTKIYVPVVSSEIWNRWQKSHGDDSFPMRQTRLFLALEPNQVERDFPALRLQDKTADPSVQTVSQLPMTISGELRTLDRESSAIQSEIATEVGISAESRQSLGQILILRPGTKPMGRKEAILGSLTIGVISFILMIPLLRRNLRGDS